jgi:hypothetical protein
VSSEKIEEVIRTSAQEQTAAMMAMYYVDAVHTDNA